MTLIVPTKLKIIKIIEKNSSHFHVATDPPTAVASEHRL